MAPVKLHPILRQRNLVYDVVHYDVFIELFIERYRVILFSDQPEINATVYKVNTNYYNDNSNCLKCVLKSGLPTVAFVVGAEDSEEFSKIYTTLHLH